MKRGKLVIFEGISGTGKETQAKLLAAYLKQKNIKTSIVYHPSPELKEILSKWRKERKTDSLAEIYLLLADRESRVKEIILPALTRGEWIISLRSWVSAMVYQGKTPQERKWIAGEFQKFEPKADYLFWLDMSPEEALERINERHKNTGEPIGKFEYGKLLAEKRKKYVSIFAKISHIRLDASKPIGRLKQQITSYINI